MAPEARQVVSGKHQDEPKLVLVTGAPRCGTDHVGGVMHLCGARVGRIVTPSEGEATWYRLQGHGQFESADVRESVQKPFMLGIGADPAGIKVLPDINRCRELAPTLAESWRRRTLSALTGGKEYGATTTFCFASSQSCLLWPIWAAAFPDAYWVVVRRRDEDVVKACKATGFTSARTGDASWAEWLETHKARFREIRAETKHAVEMWPGKFFAGDLSELRAVVEWVGLAWSEQRVHDFLAPLLWRGGIFQTNSEHRR